MIHALPVIASGDVLIPFKIFAVAETDSGQTATSIICRDVSRVSCKSCV